MIFLKLLVIKNWMALLGYFHILIILNFKGHLKMLVAYHSPYLWQT